MTAAQSGKIREFFKKYGKVGVGVHFTIYFSTLAGLGSQKQATSSVVPLASADEETSGRRLRRLLRSGGKESEA